MSTHHERDRETGFDYRGARLYDGEVGRFLSLDPAAAEFPSWSDYSYVMGNPLKFIDPTGKSPEETSIKNQENIRSALEKALNQYIKQVAEENFL